MPRQFETTEALTAVALSSEWLAGTPNAMGSFAIDGESEYLR